jgi:hypothetical protein
MRKPKPRIRCSELDRILSCPGSRLLNEIVELPVSQDGIEGSAIHYEVAWRIVNELAGSQPDGGLPYPEGVPPGYKIPSYSAWIVDWCFRCLEHVPANWVVEVETALEWEFDRFILTGHIDVPTTSPDGLEADDYDWKTGINPVEPAESNEQVAGYMVLRRLNYGIEKARFTIAQPRNNEDQGDQRESHVELVGAEALDRLVASLEARVNSALDRQMELESGKQCKYCVGLACPVLRKLKDLMKMTLTPQGLGEIRKTMPDAELVDLVADARTLKKPINDAEEILKERLAGGVTLHGTDGRTAKVVESPGGYEVVDAPGILGWIEGQTTLAQRAPMLSYPSGKIVDGLAKVHNIHKTGEDSVTAKTMFEGAAAAYLQPKTKRSLVIA